MKPIELGSRLRAAISLATSRQESMKAANVGNFATEVITVGDIRLKIQPDGKITTGQDIKEIATSPKKPLKINGIEAINFH